MSKQLHLDLSVGASARSKGQAARRQRHRANNGTLRIENHAEQPNPVMGITGNIVPSIKSGDCHDSDASILSSTDHPFQRYMAEGYRFPLISINSCLFQEQNSLHPDQGGRTIGQGTDSLVARSSSLPPVPDEVGLYLDEPEARSTEGSKLDLCASAIDEKPIAEKEICHSDCEECPCKTPKCSYKFFRKIAETVPQFQKSLFGDTSPCPYCSELLIEEFSTFWCIEHLKSHIDEHRLRSEELSRLFRCRLCLEMFGHHLTEFQEHLDTCITWGLVTRTQCVFPGVDNLSKEHSSFSMLVCYLCGLAFSPLGDGTHGLRSHVLNEHQGIFQIRCLSTQAIHEDMPHPVLRSAPLRASSSVTKRSSDFSFSSYLRSMSTNGSVKSESGQGVSSSNF